MGGFPLWACGLLILFLFIILIIIITVLVCAHGNSCGEEVCVVDDDCCEPPEAGCEFSSGEEGEQDESWSPSSSDDRPAPPCTTVCPTGATGANGIPGTATNTGATGGLGGTGGTGSTGTPGAASNTGATGGTGQGGTPGGTGGTGSRGATGAAGAGVTFAPEFAAFFGMPAGPGNPGSNDYPAPMQISFDPPSIAGTSALNFPRVSAPAVGGIAINNPGAAQTNNTEFILPSVGVYKVHWHVSVDEAGQMSLFINTAPTPGGGGTFVQVTVASGSPSNVGRATGTNAIAGDVVFSNTVAGSVIQVRNYSSPAALTITPVPGGTQAQAAVLIIERKA